MEGRDEVLPLDSNGEGAPQSFRLGKFLKIWSIDRGGSRHGGRRGEREAYVAGRTLLMGFGWRGTGQSEGRGRSRV
jgi:hypothetical protein